MTNNKQEKVVLCILDGWGVRGVTKDNGIALADTPNWDQLCQSSPMTTLEASELNVGLPTGQMGNSEVGHMSIGSGRVIMQDLPRIDHAIASGEVPAMPAIKEYVKTALAGTGVVHLLGLLSPGGVHSHQSHLFYFAKFLASQGLQVKIHAFLDGRDTPPQSAIEYLQQLQQQIEGITHIQLATVGGRYFAMDRDKRWERVQQAFDAMVLAKGPEFQDVISMVKKSYENKVTDEFVLPHVHTDYKGMSDGDSVLMVNFRADRVRQLLTCLSDPEFSGFERKRVPKFAAALGMMEYSEKLSAFIRPLFLKEELRNTLGEVISQAGLKQLRAAETEKYAHVTFFFNGGRELVFSGEDRRLIQSPAVATYDSKPEMSAPELTKCLVEAINTQNYDLIVVNYANPDMVGHTGVQSAIMKAVACVDTCLGDINQACRENKYALIITADHGNVELMIDEENNQPHTAHTLNPVPFVLANTTHTSLRPGGSLQDIAPTILSIMGLAKPSEMTGESLIKDVSKADYGIKTA